MIALPLLLASTHLSAPSAAAETPVSFALPSVAVIDGPPGSSFRYDYVDAALLLGDFDGLRGGVSFPVQGPWVAVGRLDWMTEDEGNTDVDLFLLSGGVGYVHPVQEKFDFIGSAEIEYGHAEVDNPAGSDDDDDLGLRFRGGVRFQATDEIELAGGISLSTIFDEDLGLDGQALYAFNAKISGFVGLDIRDDTVGVIGVRFGL